MEADVPEVAAQLASLYGTSELLREGVTHVTSARRTADGRLRVLAIGAEAPRSETDFFVLNLCRARADAILTSAGNLRHEPALVHTLQGPFAGALGRYRSNVLSKAVSPVCAILTRSGDLPLEHPTWQDGTTKLVLTSHAARPDLVAALGGRAEVVGFDAIDASAATRWLLARGLALVSVEAGPGANGPLYRSPVLVDELLLSLYEAGPEVPLGKALPEDATLLRGRTLTAEAQRDEASGAWRYQRWLR